MAMRKILFVCMLALAAFALVSVVSADDSSAEICDGVRVYIQNDDGTYGLTTVDGVQTVRAAVQAAAEDQGRTLELNITKTNVKSVDGVVNDSDHQWRIFQWLPPGTSGWGVQTFNDESDKRMSSGTTYCINRSTMANKDGTIVYSPPTFEPESTGYVFIRFANGFSPDNEHVKSVFTPEIRRDGFWLEGTGSNMGEVLYDAIESNWPGEIELFSGDMGGDTYSSWITSMFGLGDVNLGDNVWAYWCQWTWVDHQWSYNSNTLGYYDPAVYRYVEIIYIISTPDPYSTGYVIDKGGDEPNPETDPPVCLKNSLTAEFRLQDGTPWAEQDLKYGQRPDMTQIPDPEAESMGFTGWGDTGQPLYADAVFTASFVPVTDTMVRVRYTDEGGNLIVNEYLEPGSPATYSGTPVKESTVQYDYVFNGWSSDLSSVASDVTVTPVFDPELRSYEVSFFNYDRSHIETKSVKYGTASELPSDPVRESTVSYMFVFRGWSLTPNNYVAVDLDNVTGPMSVFAFFDPEPNEYTLTFKEGETTVASYTVKYGTSIGRTYPIDLFKGSYIVKMYRDAGLTREYSTTSMIIGDTTVYVSRVPGSYDAPRGTDGGVVGDTITVSYDGTLASALEVSGGRVLICDISQYPNGTVASIDRTSLENIAAAAGGDTVVTIAVPRGSLSMAVSDLLSMAEDGDNITFSVGNGPSSVKISTALKKINYSAFYRLNLRVDGVSVMYLSDLGLSAEVSLRSELSEGMHSDVWNITASGATTHIDSSYTGSFAVFSTDLIQFYAVGTTDTATVRQGIVVPYGEMEYETDGSGLLGHATMTGMVLDAMGETVFIPSSVGGCTLRTIGPGALNGITNTSTAVVPYTVGTFSWNGWASTLTDIYFTGPCPTFEGTAPSSVTVHYSTSTEGWDTSVGTPDLIIRKYDGSYKNDTFGFDYYRIGDSVVVHRYRYGSYVSIPESIAMDGTDYPVEYIGDASFMFSTDVSVTYLYGLKFSVYKVSTVEIPASVKGVHTRAFYGSTVSTLVNNGSSEHIWDEAFYGCSKLSNVWFNDGLVFIGRSAFEDCSATSFARVTIPDSVVAMGDRAFLGCTGVTNVHLGAGMTYVPAYCFEGCTELTEISLHDSIATIGDYAFRDCTGLQYIDLNKVSSVGRQAFYSTSGNSSMEFIVMGERTASFGSDAFGNNTRLTEIEVHCQYFEGFEKAFGNVDLSGVTFYASDDVMDSWSGFNTVPLVEPEPAKDTTLLHSVEIGLVVFFALIGAAAFIRKSKTRV